MLYCNMMTRKQKRILIILGVLDFIVIGALATIVIRTMSPTPAPPPVVQTRISRCVQAMLDAYNDLPLPVQDPATVAWDTQQLYITLSVSYPAETPPPDSAQLLWTVLDEVAAVFQGGCLVPETITIALTVHGNVETVQYLAQLAGQDITAWMAGTLPEAELAAQSHFRQTSASTD
ncbi:MAG: hypothetical protein JXR84_06905 [Anaerolineae bacterium]|nr:hypothetical protein [Anaerolineae bacterium]